VRHFFRIAALSALVLVVAACGGDDDDGGSAGSAGTAGSSGTAGSGGNGATGGASGAGGAGGASGTTTGGTAGEGGSAGEAGSSNEPVGFVPWFVHDWQSFPETHEGVSVVPASDAGYFVLSGVSAHVTRGALVDDGGPHGYGKAVRVRWPDGFPVGHGMFNYSLRAVPITGGSAAFQDSPKFQKLYVSYWDLLEGMEDYPAKWEMHWDQFRRFTLNRHITGAMPREGSASRQLFTYTYRGQLPYEGSTLVWDAGWLQDETRHTRLIASKDCNDTGFTWGTVSRSMEFDKWYRHEILFEWDKFGNTCATSVNQLTVTVWMNGEMVHQTTAPANAYYPAAEVFFNFNQSGGVASTLGDKFIRHTGVYVSGEPYTGPQYW
jgi:hypothetical protein